MTKTLTLIAGLVASGFAAAASAETVGDTAASGKMSGAAFDRLIFRGEPSADEARGPTLEEIVAVRWQDDDGY